MSLWCETESKNLIFGQFLVKTWNLLSFKKNQTLPFERHLQSIFLPYRFIRREISDFQKFILKLSSTSRIPLHSVKPRSIFENKSRKYILVCLVRWFLNIPNLPYPCFTKQRAHWDYFVSNDKCDVSTYMNFNAYTVNPRLNRNAHYVTGFRRSSAWENKKFR